MPRVSAAACTLAIASKQTIAPLVLAISLYIAITEGGKRFAQFLLATAVTGCSLLAFLLSDPAPRAPFCLTRSCSLRTGPSSLDYRQILAGAYHHMGRLEALPALFPLLFLAIWSRMRAMAGT